MPVDSKALDDAIEDIRAGIEEGRHESEAAVSQGVVLQLLATLSWPIFHTKIVTPEYRVERGRVDFALCDPPGEPVAYIEVKNKELSESEERQLFEYAFRQGVKLAVLTSGRMWSFFLPFGIDDSHGSSVHYRDRYAHKVDLMQEGTTECRYRFLRYLEFEALKSGQAVASAQEDFRAAARDKSIQSALRTALPGVRRELPDGPHERLVEPLSDAVQRLSGCRPERDTVSHFLREQVNVAPRLATPSAGPATSSATHESVGPIESTAPVPYGWCLDDAPVQCEGFRDVLVQVFERLYDRDHDFPQKFCRVRSKHRGDRAYLAERREDLLPNHVGREDKTAQKLWRRTVQLSFGWWLGPIWKRETVRLVVGWACEAAGLKFGEDLTVSLGPE